MYNLLQTGFELKSDECKPYLISALKQPNKDAKKRGKEARMSAADFIAKCTMYSKRKEQVAALFCKDRDISFLLGGLARDDKEKDVKLAACRAMYGLHEMGIMEGKKKNQELVSQYECLVTHKRSKKNLKEARKQYYAQQANILGITSGAGKEEDDDDKKVELIIPVEGMFFFLPFVYFLFCPNHDQSTEFVLTFQKSSHFGILIMIPLLNIHWDQRELFRLQDH